VGRIRSSTARQPDFLSVSRPWAGCRGRQAPAFPPSLWEGVRGWAVRRETHHHGQGFALNRTARQPDFLSVSRPCLGRGTGAARPRPFPPPSGRGSGGGSPAGSPSSWSGLCLESYRPSARFFVSVKALGGVPGPPGLGLFPPPSGRGSGGGSSAGSPSSWSGLCLESYRPSAGFFFQCQGLGRGVGAARPRPFPPPSGRGSGGGQSGGKPPLAFFIAFML